MIWTWNTSPKFKCQWTQSVLQWFDNPNECIDADDAELMLWVPKFQRVEIFWENDSAD